ncbi:MAG: succinate dehydrogenase, cytochrome b556 subunit [Thiobacillus sp.]|nr:succinate dehydrogenase, cytochrome b556 subunit [Thiobacillus sp.]
MSPPLRPVTLDLHRIRLPLPGWVSILHRFSGVLLFLALPAGVGLLSLSLYDEDGFMTALACMRHPLTRFLLLALAWGFSHHFFAGLRHLAMDAHWGVDLAHARLSGMAVFAASGLTTAAFAVWLWA